MKKKGFTLIRHPERGSRCECDGADEAVARSTMTLVSGSNKRKIPVSVETLSTHFFLFGSNLAVQKEETGGAQRKKNVGLLPPGKSKICSLASLCSRSQRRLSAFTLAEVLITLSIIGVVAALTIPAIVRNYQETQLKTQFRKAYSTLMQVLNQTNYELGGMPRCYTDNNGYGAHFTDECTAFYNEFTKNLKVIKYCQNNAFSKGCVPEYMGYMGDDAADFTGFRKNNINNVNPAWVLADGMILLGYRPAGHSLFAVDINGFKKPNKFGYDLFIFRIALNEKKSPIISPTGKIAMEPYEGGRTTQQMFEWAFK